MKSFYEMWQILENKKFKIISESVSDQLETLAKQHGQTTQQIQQQLKKISNKYWKWILLQWYQNKIRLPEDEARVKQTLNNFVQSLSRIPSNKKDINQYKTLSQIEQTVEPLLTTVQSSTKTHANIDSMPGTTLVNKKGPYEIYSITNPDTLAKLGEGTKWCTRESYKPCQAENYIKEHGKIFTIFQNGRPVAQYTPEFEQVMDINDEKLTDRKLLSLIPPPSLDNLRIAYIYAKEIIKGRWPEVEDIIKTDPFFAYRYAKYVIKGRWPEAEPYIMKDFRYAYKYAKETIKGRWPEAERYIMKTRRAYDYAKDVIKDRWPEAEEYIKKDPANAYFYAKDVIKGRWPEAEPFIKTDPTWAERYQILVLKFQNH